MKSRSAWLALSAISALPGAAYAQPIPEHSHFFGGEGMSMGFGAMMVLGPLFFFLLIGLTVVVAVLAIRWFGDRHSYVGHTPRSGSSAIDILRERFARGEIDKEEFEDRRRTIGE